MKKVAVIIFTIIALSANGQTAQEYYTAGTEKANKQDFEGSIGDFNNAIKIDPKYTDAYYNRGTSKLYLKDYKGAITDYDKTLDLKPDFIKAYTNRGVAKIKIDDTRGAIEDFDKVLIADPNNASPYYMRGQVKLQSGDTKGGCSDLSKANDLGDTRAQKLLRQYCGGMGDAKIGNKQMESLKLDWPDAEGWKVAGNQNDKEGKVIELLRNSETFDNWTEIGTMMVYPSLHSADVTVDVAMKVMFEQAKKNCSSARLTFIEKDDKAKYPWIIFKIECGEGATESQVWQIILCTDEMYVNFRAVKQKTLPDDLKDKWVTFFKTASIVTK